MGDRGPDSKTEELPLLKVDGGGDTSPAHAPPWAVHCTNKCSWLSRWPECMSTCWMTLVLVGISALVVYALSMGAYRHQQFILRHCNSSAPANNVFYHQLVPRGAQIPFLRHSEYLAVMASRYRRLQFHVVFLIDDTAGARASHSSRLLSKLVPYYVAFASYRPDEPTLRALAEFQRRYPNVNVTVMSLTKYMSGTTLRYKWKNVPLAYLPFYLGANSVWENGGVSLDLNYHSIAYDSPTTRRKAAILKQHNDGIVPEAYATALSEIDKEDTAMFTLFFGLANSLLNETRSFFNRTLTASPAAPTLIRTHRSKREADFGVTPETTSPTTDEIANVTVDNPVQNNSSEQELIRSPLYVLSKAFGSTGNLSKETGNKSDAAVVLVYDFQFVSDGVGPQYSVAAEGAQAGERPAARAAHLLSLEADGSFVAAAARLHPFLSQLLSGSLRMAPQFTIRDTLQAQCGGALRDDVYCNNIYIL